MVWKTSPFRGAIALTLFLGLAFGLGLVACSENAPPLEPEVAHCATIVGRATEAYGELMVVDVRIADIGDVRTVQLRYAYPPGSETFSFGNISCSYPFTLEIRTKPKRVATATAVYFKGRNLSETELYILNTSPFRAMPEFKLNP